MPEAREIRSRWTALRKVFREPVFPPLSATTRRHQGAASERGPCQGATHFSLWPRRRHLWATLARLGSCISALCARCDVRAHAHMLMEQLTLTVHERGVHCGLACARSAASFAGSDAGCIDLTSSSSRGSTTSTRLTRATSKPDIPHDRPTQIGHGECWKSTCTPLDTCAGTCMLCANMCGVVRHVSRNMYVGESVAFSWHISRMCVTLASAEHQRTAFESVLDLTALRHRRQVRPTS